MVVIGRQGEFHAIHDLAAMGHGDGLRNLHVGVERPTMECLAWLRLTLQLSSHGEFIAGSESDDPNDHMGHGEL